MERLIADANRVKEANGEMADLSVDSFADIVEAIHTVQDEMGIAGATAAEAEGTISGSVGMMKSAWQNLVVGFADGNADIEGLMMAFLDSVSVVADNILPVVERVLINVFNTLVENMPEMLEKGAELLGKIAAGAVKAIPTIIKAIPEIIKAIVKAFADGDVDIIEIGKDIVRGLWEGIVSLAGWIGEKVNGFFNNLFNGVKKNEQINSPSKKWAYIGENDALGWGAGFLDEVDGIQREISKATNFTTGTVDFASSGVGMSSAGMVNAMGAAPAVTGSAPTAFNLVLPDGTVFASYLIDPLIQVSRSNGTPILNPI